MSAIYPTRCRVITVLVLLLTFSSTLFSQSRVGSGYQHNAVIRNDGTLWTMGYNGMGQLGIGNTVNKNFPVQVFGTWSSVSSGYYHTAAIKSDGTLWTWGYNGYGQLGDGTVTNRLSPVQVGSANNWALIVGIFLR